MRRDYKWVPRFDLVRKEFDIPRDVSVRVWPEGQDLRSGEGLKEGEIVFSCKHFSAIRFPLHPLIHNFFYRLNLTPMQLNPNSLRILSTTLVLNIVNGWNLSLDDIFYCYNLVNIREEQDYYYLCPYQGRAFVSGKPQSEKRWKEQPVIVGGNWAAPELHFQPLRKSFGKAFRPGCFTKLDEERIQFLQQTVLKGVHDSNALLKSDHLLEVSRNRIGWGGLFCHTPAPQRKFVAVVSSASKESSSDTCSAPSLSEAREEENQVEQSSKYTMRKLPTAPVPCMKKSHAGSIFPPKSDPGVEPPREISSQKRSAEASPTRKSDYFESKKQKMPEVSAATGSRYDDEPEPEVCGEHKGKTKQLLEDEMVDVMMKEDREPHLKNADEKKDLKAETVEEDLKACRAFARGIWALADEIKLLNHSASCFSSGAPVKIMQGLLSTIGLCKKLDAYEMKIKKLESDLAVAKAENEEAYREKYEAEMKYSQLHNEVEEINRKKVAQTLNFQKRIKHLEKEKDCLLKEQEKIYESFSKQVMKESAKSFRCGWLEALKDDDANRKYTSPDAFDMACGLSPGQYLQDDD